MKAERIGATVHQVWPKLLILLALVFTLGAAGCGEAEAGKKAQQSDVEVEEPPVIVGRVIAPCGPGTFGFIGEFNPFLDWAPDGSQLIFNFENSILAIDGDGSSIRHVVFDANPGYWLPYGFHADVSPDGTRVAYSTCEFSTESVKTYDDSYDLRRLKHRYEIAVIDIDGTNRQRITDDKYLNHYPVWSPDGSRIAFIRSSDESGEYRGRAGLYTMAADGTDVQHLTPSRGHVALSPPVWSPDGERLAFAMNEIGERVDFYDRVSLYTVRADGLELTKVAETNARWVMREKLLPTTIVPTWSPDSERLAFVKSSDGETSIYTVHRDGADLRQVWTWIRGSDDGSFLPLSQISWSPDGTELLFFAHGAYLIRPDGSGLRRVGPIIFAGIAAWSSDGTRIAVYDLPQHSHPSDIATVEGSFILELQDSVLVFTVARDGSDLRILAQLPQVGVFMVARQPERQGSVDLEACADEELVPEPEANPGLVADCETLLRLRETLAGRTFLNWGERPITEWEGVTLNGEPLRVHEVSLSGLSGALPKELTDLSELRVLALQGTPYGKGSDKLTGAIPAELGKLSKLEHLNLRWNHLSGAIPPELASLSNLVSLSLEGNALVGSIPSELAALPRLRGLVVSRNSLSESIPSELANLTLLRVLDLSENRLSGSIPPNLGKLEELVILSLSGNVLSGSIPPELGDLSQLQRLQLAYNRLSGSIPPEVGKLEQLSELYLNGNTFSGCVAAELPDLWVRASRLERCA